ncbi:NRDE family protein [Flavobacterium sp. 3HN19-14]|uniref:NRDE family protein n=1 Tax=Flavobacterium sp. 3HN19-14 TaxID=3448133 RepID=UPI003EE19501
MCTVSFVKANDKIIITSNRDEQVLREAAIEPQNYTVNDKKLIYPKDPKAGGTWYAIDGPGNVMVLLNGAAEKHEVKPPYRKSRGLIVLDIISGKSPFESWKQIDLDNIEPFTLILFEKRTFLYRLRWDGLQKENRTIGCQPELHLVIINTLSERNKGSKSGLVLQFSRYKT